MTLGVFIKRRRGSRTLSSVAKAMGVSVAYLSDVEHGRRSLTLARAKQLADILHLGSDDADQLFLLAGASGGRVTIELEELSGLGKEAVVQIARAAEHLTDAEWNRVLLAIAPYA